MRMLSGRGSRDQRIEVAAHDHEVGSAIDLVSRIVGRQALAAVVRGCEIRHPHLADTVGGHGREVLLQDQPSVGQLGWIDGRKSFGKLGQAPDHSLPASGCCVHRLEADRPALQKPLAGGLGLLCA